MEGFNDVLMFLAGLADRMKQVNSAIDDAASAEDPVKDVQKSLGIRADGLVPQVPLMDEDLARRAAADPELLEKIMDGERLGDAIVNYVVGGK